MDYIEKLAKEASQLTMYDLKTYYTQAKNAVLNVSEMEAKVREATNDDPWGASSTLMQQIADGTHNFSQFNEIMPTIYSRFMEKEAREWRQIYKAMTLLEFLVKNGSERVVDDSRAHISTIKMLRNFHYIDEKGKDQGINVRNRAQELAALLADVDRIRQERRKAKANKTKYQGTGNDGGMSFVTSTGNRYGGFGSDVLGGGGSSSVGRGYDGDHRPSRNSARRQSYDEYEGADDFADEPRERPHRAASQETRRGGGSVRAETKPTPPPKKEEKKPEKEVNLFDFADDDPAPGLKPSASMDDDFDDFQQAPVTQSVNQPVNTNLFDLLDSTPAPSIPTPSVSLAFKSPMGQANVLPTPLPTPLSGVNSNTSLNPLKPNTAVSLNSGFSKSPSGPLNPGTSMGAGMGMKMSSGQGMGMTKPGNPPKPTQTKDTFDDLFAASLSSISTPVSGGGKGVGMTMGGGAGTGGKTIREMEKQKAADTLWGGNVGSTNGGSMGDLLL
ncbi:hypothetical protein TREMEDRAFT_70257 [Tremella mesenterica DSM 1558]|uniref:uncharacterized protein n=1 Tax=Tremella mesenterica (strain ATCC 24925 / CBS 8224 / DSM 1558 / NBRC 9311 / NRRL Y-6157 / RJB 2259-6 / UBC 559-6) TaxID=578456 RepID=UPI00032BD63D|nr:uncharacterized protein TREMEDRAFT_70257 [Tremella mesenterica DSM 1558]EIW66127.1 hypothetical protein TREMEDRAFT_70257 [Tremella mesenterica DSM 1558]